MRKNIPQLMAIDPDEELKLALEKVILSLNSANSSKSEATTVHVLHGEHRTLQQDFMRSVIIPTIHYFAWAKENNLVDARNEATTSLCYELAKLLKQDGDFLPCI